MNDGAPQKLSLGLAAWIPVASLALSAAAYAVGAPAIVARRVHAAPALERPSELEGALRDEPALFPVPPAVLRAATLPRARI